MCFRPPGAEPSIECPECGKKITAVMGNISPICPFCDADIASYVEEMKKKTAVPGQATATAVSGAPAPAAPNAPNKPKPPIAPPSQN